jgi:hypothetical protein
MLPLSDPDYYTFEKFVGVVLKRAKDGKCTLSEAREDIMHPFSALDKGNATEFIPWMQMMLDGWEDENA